MTISFREFPGVLKKPDEMAGPLSLSLAIGRISVRVEGLSGRMHEKASERYSANIVKEGQARHTVSLFKGAERYLEKPSDGFLKIEEEFRGDKFVMMSHDFAAAADADLREGCLLLSDPDDASSSSIALENYLLRIFSWLALRAGGFMLHSCGLENDGKAYIFFGSSGSGKSAVATMTPGLRILSDDMVLVFPENGRYMAASTPFWGALARLTRENIVLPVAGCYRIRKSTRTECVDANGPKALGMLLPCCPFLVGEKIRSDLLVPNLIGFIGKTRVCELYLPLEPEFWEMIKERPENDHD
ncbi:MAG TPA: hypothetical protein PK747_02910 [Acidobacteriota bacterium]|nr:hypothetical protein [Acidobacteriota bacterium]HNT17300.1 hypothetical protein [Acidobacteriota bacterium]HQO19741.1 hypothetical protein [Acidobacteriota bacterium]HQQ46345.1 hypothetical protein [Acidobacteriota bacterium]